MAFKAVQASLHHVLFASVDMRPHLGSNGVLAYLCDNFVSLQVNVDLLVDFTRSFAL